jgi:uncharacterized membrane protein (DUF485 family)
MASDDRIARVMANPAYRELIRRRHRASLGYFVVMLAVYFGFILILAFAPGLFARPIGPGFTMSVGIAAALAVLISAVVMVALYVRLSNKRFDPLIERILEDVK